MNTLNRSSVRYGRDDVLSTAPLTSRNIGAAANSAYGLGVQNSRRESSSLIGKTNVMLTWTLFLGSIAAVHGMRANLMEVGISVLVAIISAICLYGFRGGWVPRIRTGNTALAVVLMSLYVIGMSVCIGYFNGTYAKLIGWNTIIWAYVGTTMLMLICGTIASLSTFNFRSWEFPLYVLLWFLNIVGFSLAYDHFHSPVNMAYCVAGIVIFTGFFLCDLQRYARSHENNWIEAIDISTNLFLDYINVADFLIQFLIGSRKEA